MKTITPLLLAACLVLVTPTGVASAPPGGDGVLDALVVVHRLWGTDERGVRRLLLDDPAGRVVSLARLGDVVARLEASDIPPGSYGSLAVDLGDVIYVVGEGGRVWMSDLRGRGLKLSAGLSGSLVVADGIEPRNVEFDSRRSPRPLAAVARLLD